MMNSGGNAPYISEERLRALLAGKAPAIEKAAKKPYLQTSKKLQYIDRLLFGAVVICAAITAFFNTDMSDKLFEIAKFVAAAMGLGTAGYMYNSAAEKKALIEAEEKKYEADLRDSEYEAGDL